MSTYSDGTRDCKVCERRLPLESFWFENKEKNLRHYRCKDCHAIHLKEWVDNHKGARLASSRKYGINKGRAQRIHKLYGLTVEDLEKMIEDQNGKCAICGNINFPN